jgi:hypothetical protein
MHPNFGLYKCQVCGNMVMGNEKERHEKDVHRGFQVEWKRMR